MQARWARSCRSRSWQQLSQQGDRTLRFYWPRFYHSNLKGERGFPPTDANVAAMDTFSLGALTVHRIGFGAMQLPGPGVIGPPSDHDEAVAVLRDAVDLGVDHIDAAQYYGPDVSDGLIREALHPYSDDLVLVSKVGAFRDDQGGSTLASGPSSCAWRSRMTCGAWALIG